MIKNLFLKLSGGRPMNRLGYAFTDIVSGHSVHYWEDRFGRKWLAEGPWSWFRVARNEEVK